MRARAADVLEAVVGEPDDPELALLVEALADHQLVALLEDVERHELAGQQDEAEREQREALDRLRPSALRLDAMRATTSGGWAGSADGS